MAALRHFFDERGEGIAAAWLFGSVARGAADAASDVDVAVLYAQAPEPALDSGPLDLEGDLEALLRRETQLVVLNRAPVDLVHRVLRDGVLVCERDPKARVAFEVRSRREYFDVLPHLHRYRKHAWWMKSWSSNILVHGYTKVDAAQLRSAVENNLGDLLAFVEAVRTRLRAP